MSVKDNIWNYLKLLKREFSVEELIKEFKINPSEIDCLLDVLYDLEKLGKLFFNEEDKKYMVTPKEFYYQLGTIMKSKSGNYYIKGKDGEMVLFKNNHELNIGDIVYYIAHPTEHSKHFNGEIVRFVKREKPNISYSFIINDVLKNDGNQFYIEYNKKRIIIDKKKLNNAFVGDLVNVNIYNNKGSVVKVLKRAQNEHIFQVIKNNNSIYCIPTNGSYGKYYLSDDNIPTGTLLLASIGNDNKLNIVKELGNSVNVKKQIELLTIESGFNREFPDNVMDMVNKISDSITDDDLEGRVDLRDLETFTIDPVTAKDLDDAVSLECIGDKYVLYVHTANPSHYIKYGTPIFYEALKRCFSVYPGNDVIPMLPDKLSSGVCSLNEDGDKLAITFKIEIDKDGKLGNMELFRSVIRNNKKMNYDAVNSILDNNYDSFSDDYEDYKPFFDTLFKMKELSNVLEKKRIKRGSISFDNNENVFVLDDDENIIELKEKSRGVAQRIIENFMLVANENIAVYVKNLGLPYIYRNHEKPTIEKKMNLKSELCDKGYNYGKLRNTDSPIYFQQYLNKVLKGKSNEEKKFIYDIFLKSMSRAYYDYINTGHYGLALDCYGTFTSPARKVSDLINHMIVEEFLKNGYSNNIEVASNLIKKICDYISKRQQDADELELNIYSLILNSYIADYMDIELSARVLFVNNSEIHIKTDNNLTGVIYSDDSSKYKPGSKINVRLDKNDCGTLVFLMVNKKNKVLKKAKKNEETFI